MKVNAAAVGEGAARRLFVYGSLRAGEDNEMARLLHRHARHLGEGTIRARLYAVIWYSAAVACEDEDARVHGDLFALDPPAAGEVLAALDEYEGSDFSRARVEVALGDETSLWAESYLFAASVAGLRRVGHGDWRRERGAGGSASPGAGHEETGAAGIPG